MRLCIGPIPVQVRHAYGLDLLLAAGTTGRGQKIGIVDSYGDPSIQTNLNNFAAITKFPRPPSRFWASPPLAAAGGPWKLDVEWASDAQPNTTIIFS